MALFRINRPAFCLAGALALLAATSSAQATTFLGDPAASCGGLAGPAQQAARIDSATLEAPSPLSISERAPTPAGRISPANPAFCKVLGHIDPTDPKAPPIKFEVNLPVEWNDRSLQYGGGGFNGVLITGLGLPPAYPYDKPSPLAQGFVTYGTDSGHQTRRGELPQLFALNDEAFENFSHRSYKKVRDIAVALVMRAYGKPPARMYFMGSSEGGREALTMAQRYPEDFDGIFARAPVINWVGLQHAGTRSGLVTMGEGWIRPAQVKLVANAVLQACDKADGSEDLLVEDAVGCKANFRVESLRCAEGRSGDQCLTDAQIAAINTLHSTYKFPFPLANGLDDYPGWGVSGEDAPSFGPTGGWIAWWLGTTAPVQPPIQTNGIAWVYGAGGIQYVFARDPNLDVTKYKPEDYKERVLEVSRTHGLDQSGSEPFSRARRQAVDPRAHVRLCAEPLCRHSLFRKCAANAREGRDGGIRTALHRTRRRSRRLGCARERRYAECAGRLGGEGQSARQSRGGRAEGRGAVVRNSPCPSAVPMARLAALSLRPGKCLRQLLLRALKASP